MFFGLFLTELSSHNFNHIHLVKSGVVGGKDSCHPSLLTLKRELELPISIK